MDRSLTYLTGHLPNGLRYVIYPRQGITECTGVIVNAGSRDELTAPDFGLAHFVEHTIFKGTPRHSGSYVLNRMEAVGGELNAYTTKEETAVYSSMPAGNFARAIALIGELCTTAAFPDRGINLEREVICDEIDSYLDSPAEACFDRFDEEAFAATPLAHNILGTKESVGAITGQRCRLWLNSQFTAANSVFFYSGPLTPTRVITLASRAFAAMPPGTPNTARVQPAAMPTFDRLESTGAHQCHTVMGAPIGGMHSEQRVAISLAANILGGPGLNSQLNLALRERNGLVYTIDASCTRYSDCGMMTIYFGCDHADLKRCKQLVTRTLNRLASHPLTNRQITAAKRQYIGQLTLAFDNKEQVILNAARALLHGLTPASPTLTASRLEAVTPDQLRQAAEVLALAPQRTLTLA